MSRGDRSVAPGNISHSMRENYQQGVLEYYRKVGSVYRNPHFPGIRRCLFQWLNRWIQTHSSTFPQLILRASWWWQMESQTLVLKDEIIVFDMACGRYLVNNLPGSGEATLAFQDWWKIGRALHDSNRTGIPNRETCPQKKIQIAPPPIPPDSSQPKILAADPFTSAAYYDRTSLPCSPLSFKDISEGSLPSLSKDTLDPESLPSVRPIIDLIICSFALHLVSTPSELFSLLWELSLKARWLVVLAPHKKPEIKEGWGWCKWDTVAWKAYQMVHSTPDILNDRVHCRVYRSLNVE